MRGPRANECYGPGKKRTDPTQNRAEPRREPYRLQPRERKTGRATRERTRPDARLPQSRAGGQRLYLRSLDHLGRNSEAKDRKKKVKCKGQTDGPTDRPTKRGVG